MSRPSEYRTYRRAECVTFRKTDEAFGGLSNMAPGYPVRVNGVRIFTVEALYQACRFPHRPEVQQHIIGQTSPMTAKMVSKPYRKDSRQDWDRVRVKIMRWCLRMKLTQHWPKFSQLLLSTGERPIVEDSRKDSFWGALPQEDQTLMGMNVLGRLLMELREAIKQGVELRRVEPPAIPNFLLLGKPLEIVDFRIDKSAPPIPAMLPTNEFTEELNFPSTKEVVAQPTLVEPVVPPHQPSVETKPALIEGLKAYSKYKESGIPWTPLLPSGWRVERAKRLFTKMDRPVRPEDDVVTCFRDGMVTLRKNRRLRGFTEATVESGYQGIRKGDLVIHGMDAFAGAIGVSDSDGKGTPVYNVCQPRPGVIASYYAHTVREMARAQWILALAKGIRERSTDFRYEMFGNQHVPVPPPEEQASIVKFLDHANRKIDGFIRAKRKIIKLLDDQKRAIIQRAVTRGLNPHVQLKPSGIPWLGDIPSHWELSRVKNEFACLNPQRIPLSGTQRGAMTARTYDYYGASGVIDKVDDFIFNDELLLIAEDGANLVLRNLPLAIIARGKFWVNNHAHILKTKRGNLEYLAGFMETLNYQPWISGAAQPKLTKDRLMSISVAVAPVKEQGAIVEYFTEQIFPLRKAIARTEREIELMLEFRVRLRADIVSGKLDVREAAAKLPEPPAETTTDTFAVEALEEVATEE